MVTENGLSASVSTQGPGSSVSYAEIVLENVSPAGTMRSPRQPNRCPIAMPMMTTMSAVWKTRLPVSRR